MIIDAMQIEKRAILFPNKTSKKREIEIEKEENKMKRKRSSRGGIWKGEMREEVEMWPVWSCP